MNIGEQQVKLELQQQNTGHGNHKKNQSEMKDTLTERKNNL